MHVYTTIFTFSLISFNELNSTLHICLYSTPFIATHHVSFVLELPNFQFDFNTWLSHLNSDILKMQYDIDTPNLVFQIYI